MMLHIHTWAKHACYFHDIGVLEMKYKVGYSTVFFYSVGGDRDVFNEKPSREEIYAATEVHNQV